MSDGDLLYVGTYTDREQSDGIYIVRLNRGTGELRIVGCFDAGPNPSFLTVHPNRRLLFTVNEIDDGSVSAFRVDAETGALSRINAQSSEGAAPCYLAVDQSGRALLVANYAGGSIAMLPIAEHGTIAKAPGVAQLTRNAHCVVPDPSNRFVLCADLGADRVFVYRLDLERKTLRHVADAVMRAGAGPRHVVFHPTLPLVFVANELDSTVASFHFDKEHGTLSPSETHSTLPMGWKGTNYPAEILVAPDGLTLYVSNRGNNSIAVFSVAESTGALALEQVISTEGDWPRHFTLDPSAQWLVAANQRSGSVIVFERDQINGSLTLTPQRLEIPSPACLRFLAT